MTVLEVLAMIATGVAAGIASTVASVASFVSYPALLAIGLPPLSANMTNTVSLLFTGAGAALGSRPELTGYWRRVRDLGVVAALGGAAGAGLLLITPAQTFQRVAPVLIGVASLLLLRPPAPASGGAFHDRAAPGAPVGGPSGAGAAGTGAAGTGAAGAGAAGAGAAGAGLCGTADAEHGPSRPSRPGRRRAGLTAALFGVTIYVGYFGAAGGILMLAVLLPLLAEPLARTNAVKNVVGGCANAVAAIAFAAAGHVDWAVVPPLAAGFLAGGWIGPGLVRRIPAGALRLLIAAAGLAVAVVLGVAAYR